VAAGHVRRAGDRGQVDRRVPGEQEADVAVDRGPDASCQLDAEDPQGAVQLMRVRAGELWE
jgi:hypothetical protein